MRHKLHGFVHRIEGNRIVQEEEIRLVTGVPLHLPDEPLLLFPIHGRYDLLVELPELRRLADPIVGTVERESAVETKCRGTRRIHP